MIIPTGNLILLVALLGPREIAARILGIGQLEKNSLIFMQIFLINPISSKLFLFVAKDLANC